MSARLRLRLTMIGGAILSVPIVRNAISGSIAMDAAAIRIFVAFAFTLISVTAMGGLLRLYAPPPTVDAEIEDAELVDEVAPNDDSRAG